MCGACHGRGTDVEITCPDCNGTGCDPNEDNAFAQCHTCYDEGTVLAYECPNCNDEGTVERDR